MAKKKTEEAGGSQDLLTSIKNNINEQLNRTVAYNMKTDDPLEVKQ